MIRELERLTIDFDVTIGRRRALGTHDYFISLERCDYDLPGTESEEPKELYGATIDDAVQAAAVWAGVA